MGKNDDMGGSTNDMKYVKVEGNEPIDKLTSKGCNDKDDESLKKLKRATIFVFCFFIMEVIGGIWSGSLSVITDAAHLLIDVSGFVLAIVAQEISSRPANAKHTYGLVRAEVLSALFSTMFILFLSLILTYEAIKRIIDIAEGHTLQIKGEGMFIIATIGLVVNVILLLILGDSHDHSHGHDHSHDHGHSLDSGYGLHDKHNNLEISDETTPQYQKEGHLALNSDSPAGLSEDNDSMYGSCERPNTEAKKVININISGAALHVITDLIQSAGVMLAGAILWWKPHWELCDPLLNILLEGTPQEFDQEVVRKRLLLIPGVTNVHCLHIWSLTLGKTVVTAHIKALDPEAALRAANSTCRGLGIIHSTIQVQRDNCVSDVCADNCTVHPCEGVCCT